MSIIEKAIQASAPAPRNPRRNKRGPVAPLHGEPVPGRVSFESLRDKRLMLTREESPRTVDQIRRLKRPILSHAGGLLMAESGNLVMVTSDSPGAGKTFTSIHLAQALSLDRDRNVLLVDADNTKATLTEGFGASDRPGLFDVLDDTALTIDMVTMDTDIPGLRFVPTGRRFEDSEELLTSSRAADVFRRMAAYDSSRVVIMDSPPMLSCPDALPLATLAGQILLVVAAGATDQHSLERTLELLDQEKPIGLVLNRAPLANWMADYRADSYYAYQR